MYVKFAWILAAGLALGATAEAQTVKGLLDKAGSSASAVSGNTGPATESEVDSLADKVAACNKLDTQGMIDCATGLAPVAADLASRAADSGMLGTQVKELSGMISSMTQGKKVPAG